MNKILIYISIFFIVTNCNLKPNIEHHGIHMLEKKNQKLKLNETNRNDILKILGAPSTKSTFDNDVMFYIERKISTGKLVTLGKRKY